MSRRGGRMMLLAGRNNERRQADNEYRENYERNRENRENRDWNETRHSYTVNYYPADGYDDYREENRRRRDRRGRYMTGYDYDYEMPPHEYNQQIGFKASGMLEHGGAEGKTLDRRSAEKIVRRFENADGSRGPHWQYSKVEEMMQQYGLQYDPAEMYVALNMMYSDYCNAAKKLGCNNVDFYTELAKAFLDDPDAKDGKLMRYLDAIPDKN